MDQLISGKSLDAKGKETTFEKHSNLSVETAPKPATIPNPQNLLKCEEF